MKRTRADRATSLAAKPDDPRARLPNRSLRRRMLERDGYRCRKCGHHAPDGAALSPHHVIAYANGGPTTLDNLHTLCLMCHDELTWLWNGSPLPSYAEWLQLKPAVALIRELLIVRDRGEHAAVLSAVLEIDSDTAARLLRNKP